MNMHRFSKILIGNRGEIASRIIRTTKQMGIKSIAVCNQLDLQSPYVHQADEAIVVPGHENIFVDAQRLVNLAKENGADAIHPGYGFISENPMFSKLCDENGIKFIGPSYSTMQLLSSKKDAKELAKHAGIPVVPGYNGANQSITQIINEIHSIGFPVLLKATMGGGGRGMRVLQNDSNIHQIIEMCKSESHKHFGDGSLIIEKFLPETRHIEVQVFGDKEGNAVHFGERECSLQRNYQKVIEEAPCFYLTEKERSQLYSWATQIIHDSHYEGAGTVEFLYDNHSHQFYFMEVNTRLQVEHLVSQCINNQIDLVELQIRIAQGETIPSIGIHNYSSSSSSSSSSVSQLPSIYKQASCCAPYAMECRVYNEDPSNHFLPGEGECHYKNHVTDTQHTMIENNITATHQHQGVSFDPMLLKVITTGQTRTEVIERMEDALRRCTITGIPTNIQFLVNALRMKKFREEGATSCTVKEEEKVLMDTPAMSLFEISNTIASYLMHHKRYDIQNPWLSLPSFTNTSGLKRFEYFMINQKPVQCSIEPTSMNDILLKIQEEGKKESQVIPISFIQALDDEIIVKIQDKIVRNIISADSNDSLHIFPVTSTKHFHEVQYSIEPDWRFGRKMATSNQVGSLCDILCPMPSTITQIAVKNGDKVKKGDVLLVIEAMKMEHIITAPHDGIVELNQLEEKQFVKKGQCMLRVV